MLKKIALTSFLILAQDSPGKLYPPGVVNDFFKSLRQPGSGISCCDISDCNFVEADTDKGKYRFRYRGRWIEVPDTIIVRNVKNITGQFIACYNEKILDKEGKPLLYCFVEGTLS